MELDKDKIQALRDEVAQLLADALRVADETHAETDRHVHDEETHNMDLALATRDIIGQAKGVIMVTMHCTADDAFLLLVNQSQAENRKIVEIATEITSRVSRSDGIAEWWAALTDQERGAVLRHRPSTPMTPWLVRSLHKARIAELVEEPPDPDIVAPCFFMPAAVADYVDRQRRE